MKRVCNMRCAVAVFFGAMTSICLAQESVGTAFTYQGLLEDGGGPASGDYDFQFALYDSSGGSNQVGSTLSRDDVPVQTGRFAVELDYGGVFDGRALWIEVRVRRDKRASQRVVAEASSRFGLDPEHVRVGPRIRGSEQVHINVLVP